MNTAFNSALKQSTSIRKDLTSLSTALGAHPSASQQHQQLQQPPVSAAAFGALSASLTAFARTVDEYNALAKQELNTAKKEKAFDRIRNFQTELGEFRVQFNSLKAAKDDAAHQNNRSELLGRRPFAATTPENPYATSSTGTSTGAGIGAGHSRTVSTAENQRETHALREQNFFASTNTALDEYIARGQAVLGDLGNQRDMLKNTQKRMYTVANTLGISGDTIRMIERRAREDKWIFWAGVVVFILFCWLCLHFLR
ncbi:MAG: Protein transport protein bos1 [Sporothrix epigloea]